MLQLRRPEKTVEQLRALAASGVSGLARKAQAELRDRMAEKLSAEIGRSPSAGRDGHARS